MNRPRRCRVAHGLHWCLRTVDGGGHAYKAEGGAVSVVFKRAPHFGYFVFVAAQGPLSRHRKLDEAMADAAARFFAAEATGAADGR